MKAIALWVIIGRLTHQDASGWPERLHGPSAPAPVSAEAQALEWAAKDRLLDLVESFLLFDASKPGGTPKVVAREFRQATQDAADREPSLRVQPDSQVQSGYPPRRAYSRRDDIIVISDEAHRTQTGKLACNMRLALTNASFIGFTGTPLFTYDHLSRRIFGTYISRYDFKRSEDDGATVKLVYENRGEKLGLIRLDLNDRIADKIEEADLEPDQEALLEKLLGKDYEVITADNRLDKIADDFVEHCSTRWESGKSMADETRLRHAGWPPDRCGRCLEGPHTSTSHGHRLCHAADRLRYGHRGRVKITPRG